VTGAAPFGDEPGLWRRDHQATARQAAFEVMPRTGTQRREILRELYRAGRHGWTRDEIAERLELSPNTVRPRVKELIDGGWVEASGETRPSAMNREAEVLVVTAKTRGYRETT
jgi:predicted ArsR family transcriptional regulator